MLKSAIVVFALALIPTQVFGLTLKVGVLAPEGTTWAKSLKKLAKRIKKETNKKVKLKIYFGGAIGDEPDVLRKIRVGQLQGGIFTGKTLGDINGDVRVMELPFTFYHDRAKALKTMQGLEPFFNKGFAKGEFHNLGFFELGLIYFVSKKSTPSIDSLKGLKIWSWEGDELVAAMIKEMNLISVPLPLPDVLTSLQTGIIEAAYAPPLGIVALQWNTKVKYLVNFPISYSTGAFLISSKAWAKIKPEHKTIINKLAKKHITEVNIANAKDNIDAMAAMKDLGIEFIKFSDKDIATAKSYRSKIVKKLKGKLFSADALSRLEKAIK